MPQKGLVGNRAVVERNYAILPPQGIPESALPEWTGTAARVLAAPAMGARFAMYLLALAPGGGSAHALPEDVEAFFYAVSGECKLDLGRPHALGPGGFAYLHPGARFKLGATAQSRLIWLKKVYEPFDARRPADVLGHEGQVKGEPFMGVDDLRIPGLLHGRTVRSTVPRGRITRVTLDPAFDWKGVTIADHRDIPGENVVALIEDDQPLLAASEIRHAEEPVLLLAHEDAE